MSPQLNPQLIEHDQEMEHPPPLPTTSLEDLPPPYLDYLDAAALCRLGYGTTKKQHFGVTSAAVRGATERDAVPLGATAPPGARDALELLRRRERAVCWEPFGARSQFLRRRWRRGPTTPDDAPRDGDDDDEPPRPWRYRELRTTAAGLVLDGGGEMNFTGVHRPFGGVRRPTRKSGDGSDAESRSDFDEEDEEDEGVARPASFAEIVDDDVDVDEAPNLSV